MPTDFTVVLSQKGASVSLLISTPGEPLQCPWGGSVLTYSTSAPGGHNHPTFPGGLYLKLWSPSKGTFSPGPKPLSGRIGHKRITWSSEFPVASVDAVTARRGCWRENGVRDSCSVPGRMQRHILRGEGRWRCGEHRYPPGKGEGLAASP